MEDKDKACPKCEGRGWVKQEDGIPAVCSCRSKAELREYLRPIMTFLRPPVELGGQRPAELGDENQAIVVSNENIASLVYFASHWKEEGKKYDLVGIEELNTIGMKGTAEYRSLSDYVRANENFILDMSSVNPMRPQGFREKDEMVLLDFLKMVSTRTEKRVVMLIGPTASEFKAEHKELCKELAKWRLPYFDYGKKYAFARAEKRENVSD